jgi:hypothetical protein
MVYLPSGVIWLLKVPWGQTKDTIPPGSGFPLYFTVPETSPVVRLQPALPATSNPRRKKPQQDRNLREPLLRHIGSLLDLLIEKVSPVRVTGSSPVRVCRRLPA